MQICHQITNNNFEQIQKHILQFELDNRNLKAKQFLCIKNKHQVIAFGRIREHTTCSELCSLGVTEPKRLQGFGGQLVKALIKKATKPLYLVCIIPDYFKSFGFRITTNYPIEIQEKLDYCMAELVVPETYVVMEYEIN